MSRLYVFAIGGSGARVLRSLTMLLASGVDTKHEIVPIIVDADQNNGDRTRTVDIMRKYKEIRKVLEFNREVKNKFFRTLLTPLSEQQDDYTLPLDGESRRPFQDWLHLANMSKENQALARMLFSNTNLATEMKKGFYGNPNIGSVVLNQFPVQERGVFRDFVTSFNTGDTIFIISSIFGGTGASGFPLLLKSFRDSSNDNVKRAPIGAVSLLPYFKLREVPSKVQSDSFMTKTKAALGYYEQNVTGNDSLDHIYYLGDDFTDKLYDNNEGDSAQKNDAHIIEMLAALAVLDFDKKNIEPSDSHPTHFHEFGLSSRQIEEKIVFTDISYKTNGIIRLPLTQMSLLNSYLENRKEDHMVEQKYAKERNGAIAELLKSDEFNNYKTFKGYFDNWLKELSDNKIGFKPFHDDCDLKNKDALTKVIGVKPNYPFGHQKEGYDLLDKRLSSTIDSIPENLSAFQAFFELFYLATKNICEKTLKLK